MSRISSPGHVVASWSLHTASLDTPLAAWVAGYASVCRCVCYCCVDQCQMVIISHNRSTSRPTSVHDATYAAPTSNQLLPKRCNVQHLHSLGLHWHLNRESIRV